MADYKKSATSQLLLPGGIGSEYKKAAAPKTGPSFGAWGGPGADITSLTLPGGGLLQFDLSKLTLGDFRSMRSHYQINISLSILAFTMHQMDWNIECSDPRIKNHVEENLREIWTRLIRGVSQAYWAGYSPMALQYENDLQTGFIDIGKVKDLVPEQCSVNWKQVPGAVTGSSTAPKRYVYDGIKQQGTTGHIPSEHSLWYPLLMENGNMYGRKLLKSAFPAWFFSQLIHLFANRYFERFGEPLPIGRAPFDAELDKGDGTTVSGREAMEDIVQNIRNRAAVVLPSDRAPGSGANGGSSQYDYEIEYLESQMRGVDFERYMTRLDEEMSIGMFMPVLLFRTADVGSYNLGQAHERMFMWMMNTLAGDLKEYLDRYVLDRMVDFNFGPKAPRARFVFRQMGKVQDETLRAMIQASIQQEHLKPNVEDLAQVLGVKLDVVQQLTEDEPTPAADPVVEPDTDTGNTESDNSRKLGLVAGRIEGRVSGQVRAAFKAGTTDRVQISMGHESQLRDLLPDASSDDIKSMVHRMSVWSTESLASGVHKDTDAFMENFSSALDSQITGL